MTTKIAKIFYPALFGLLGLLLLVNLLVSQRLAIKGEEIEQFKKEAQDLELENNFLKREIAQSSSISGIIKEAKKLGFENSPAVFYLKKEPPVAMK